jgi:hypothetical protein
MVYVNDVLYSGEILMFRDVETKKEILRSGSEL